MNNLYILAGIGTVGVAGGGGAYLIHNVVSKAPEILINSRYYKALLNDKSDDAIWDVKLAVLGSNSSIPKNKHLIRAKEEKKVGNLVGSKASLKQGCKEIYSQSVDNRDAFGDFKSFCSFSNKDKIVSTRQLVSENGDFDNSWSSFNSSKKDELYGGFKDIKEGSSTGDDGWKGRMLFECNRIAGGIFEGEVGDFTRFCTKDKSTPIASPVGGAVAGVA